MLLTRDHLSKPLLALGLLGSEGKKWHLFLLWTSSGLKVWQLSLLHFFLYTPLTVFPVAFSQTLLTVMVTCFNMLKQQQMCYLTPYLSAIPCCFPTCHRVLYFTLLYMSALGATCLLCLLHPINQSSTIRHCSKTLNHRTWEIESLAHGLLNTRFYIVSSLFSSPMLILLPKPEQRITPAVSRLLPPPIWLDKLLLELVDSSSTTLSFLVLQCKDVLLLSIFPSV